MRMVPFPELDINDFDHGDSERPNFNQGRMSEKVPNNSTPVKDDELSEKRAKRRFMTSSGLSAKQNMPSGGDIEEENGTDSDQNSNSEKSWDHLDNDNLEAEVRVEEPLP